MTEQFNYSSRFFKADQRSVYNVNGHTTYVAGTGGDDNGLLFFKDEQLSADASCEHVLDEGTLHFILPVVGALHYTDNSRDMSVKPEEMLVIRDVKGFTLNNRNVQTINYFHFALKENGSVNTVTTKHAVQLKEYNQPFLFKPSETGFQGALGVYRGRSKGRYTLSNPKNRVFALVINGAFEVEDRLMEHRDGLLIWDAQETEYEALSEFAILLIIEIPH